VRVSKARGAFQSVTNSGNFGWEVNGKQFSIRPIVLENCPIFPVVNFRMELHVPFAPFPFTLPSPGP